MRKIAKELKFLIAEKEREEITIKQMKKIKKLYDNAAKDFARNYKMLKGRDNISSVLRRQYIDEMQKDLSGEITKISKQIEQGIEGAILQTSESVVRDNQRMLSNMGFNIKKAFSYVPTDVVETITSGQLYQSDWTLSKAIWGDNKKTISDIHEVIAKGLIENKGSYDIAKDLEKYVDPNVAKDWDWSKVYPNTKRKVEYNAQRLARTLTSHAYQESFVRSTQGNPFINAYRWETSNSHTTCDLCYTRESQDLYGLGAGLYPKDALPLDHPNGKCIVVLNMEGSMSDISDQIAEWYNSPEGTFPDIDKFANSFDKGSGIKQTVTKHKKEVAEKVKLKTGKQLLQMSGQERYDILGIKDFDWGQIENDVKEMVYETTNRLNNKFKGMKEYFSNYSDCSYKAGTSSEKRIMESSLGKKGQTLYFKFSEIHSKNINELINIERKSLNLNWSMPCSDEFLQSASFTHEYGHAVSNYLISEEIKKSPELLNIVTKGSNNEIISEFNKLEESFYNEIKDIASKGNKRFDESLYMSKYGLSSFSEFFAECFSNSQCGKPNIMGKAMEEFLKRKGVL